jgi:hypothetical protein
MTPIERKAAFKAQAARNGKTLNAAAYEACGVTWFHLSEGIAGKRPIGEEVREKFSAYIGRSARSVFGSLPVFARTA